MSKSDKWDIEEIISLYSQGKSIPEVSEITGTPRSTVRHHVKLAGILRSRSDGVRQAGDNGRLGSGLRGKKECSLMLTSKKLGSQSYCKARCALKESQ